MIDTESIGFWLKHILNIEENILEYLRQINSFLSFNLPLKKVHETAFEQEIMKAIKWKEI